MQGIGPGLIALPNSPDPIYRVSDFSIEETEGKIGIRVTYLTSSLGMVKNWSSQASKEAFIEYQFEPGNTSIYMWVSRLSLEEIYTLLKGVPHPSRVLPEPATKASREGCKAAALVYY
jgi:hypothetical protein